MRNAPKRFLQSIPLLALLMLCPSKSRSESTTVFEPAIRLALGPTRKTAQYNYVMTGKVRLLLVWLGADDVGGGYIRRGVSASDPSTDFIQVLFGSDPAKAPRRINHWGTAIETSGNSSALFGFMKSTKTSSPETAQAEMQKQAEKGEHAFEAIVSLVDGSRAISRVVPLKLDTDFNLHQLTLALQLAVERLAKDGPVRQMDPANRKCAAARGFLHAVDSLAKNALKPGEAKQSLCYVHNARDYTLTLRKRSHVDSREIEFKMKSGKRITKKYENLILAQFETLNHQSGENTQFELIMPESGQLAGIPIQITHQPNFWFKVVLNLEAVEGQ